MHVSPSAPFDVLLAPQVMTATPNHIVYIAAGASPGATPETTTATSFAERLPLFAKDIKVQGKAATATQSLHGVQLLLTPRQCVYIHVS